MTVRILVGDALAMLKTLPDESVQCCVTSPPYWGLRDYGVAGQLGLEKTPDEYVARMVEVFREVRRVLRKDGTLWLNIGDSYATTGKKGSGGIGKGTIAGGKGQATNAGSFFGDVRARCAADYGVKDKDLVGIPWMLAFALRADGWYLRSDIIWSKPNPMPESVLDRPTKSHEYVFLFAKSERYFYDCDAIREPYNEASLGRYDTPIQNTGNIIGARQPGREWNPVSVKMEPNPLGRNRRSVWEITTQPFPESHFATMPPDLAEVCVKAGSSRAQSVLDPFGGAGTTGLVADRLGRHATLIELNPEYAAMAERRIRGDNPLFTDVNVA